MTGAMMLVSASPANETKM